MARLPRLNSVTKAWTFRVGGAGAGWLGPSGPVLPGAGRAIEHQHARGTPLRQGLLSDQLGGQVLDAIEALVLEATALENGGDPSAMVA